MEKSSVSNGLSFLSLGIAVGALLVSILTPGAQGASGPAGSNGQNGSQGSSGLPGSNGETPYIGNNGNWWIDGVDTGVPANDFNQSYRDIPEIAFAEREEETLLLEETLFEPFETDEFRLIYANDLIDEEGFIGISTPAELMAISEQDGNYVLTGNIDFNGYSNWSPINFEARGDEGVYFSGILDGAGFFISGLSGSSLDENEAYSSYGLFEGLDGATIRHLNFVGNSLDIPAIDGRNKEFGGILAGMAFNSSLYNINSGLSFVGGSSYLGSLVGVFEDSEASFINVDFASVEGVGYLGGVFGTVWNSTISHVEANTSIFATQSHIGGIAGASEESVYLSIESIFTIDLSEDSDALYQVEIGGVIGKSYYDRLISIITYGSLNFQPTADNYYLEKVGGVIGYGFNLTLVNVENYIDIEILMGDSFTISGIKSIGGVVGGVEFGNIINAVNFEEVKIIPSEGDFDVDYYINTDEYPIEYLGGVVGYTYSSVNLYRVANFGFVMGIAEVGGIMGSSGNINFYFQQLIVANEIANFGTVEGYALVGGFTGINDGRTNLILGNFMNCGNIYAVQFGGGLIGIVSPRIDVKVQIINSYNFGTVTVNDYAAGGLVGALVPEENFWDFPFFGDLSIFDSFNLGEVIVTNLGREDADYYESGAGAIFGVRVLLAIMDGVSYLEQISDIPQYIFDDASQSYVPTGESVTMNLPAAGDGNHVDIQRIEDESKLVSDEDFIYQSDWNFQTVWKRNSDANIGLGELPYLRFLDDVSDRRP
jgi:hypothetical protein